MEITTEIRNAWVEKQIQKEEYEKQIALLKSTMDTERSRLETEIKNYIANMQTEIDNLQKSIDGLEK